MQYPITHETLRLLKFRGVLKSLQELQLPLPGTIFSVKDIPKTPDSATPKKHYVFFPNHLVLAGLEKDLNSLTHPQNIKDKKVTDVRAAFEKASESPSSHPSQGFLYVQDA